MGISIRNQIRDTVVGGESLRPHDRGGLIMRAPLLLALVLLGTAPAWAAEEPSGCDNLK
jgi:hypothetical protein